MIVFEKYLYCLKVRYSSDKLLVMCFFVSNVGSLNPSPPLPLFAYKKKCLKFTLIQRTALARRLPALDASSP